MLVVLSALLALSRVVDCWWSDFCSDVTTTTAGGVVVMLVGLGMEDAVGMVSSSKGSVTVGTLLLQPMLGRGERRGKLSQSRGKLIRKLKTRKECTFQRYKTEFTIEIEGIFFIFDLSGAVHSLDLDLDYCTSYPTVDLVNMIAI